MFEHITAENVAAYSEDEILAAAEILKATIEDATAALEIVKTELAQRVDNMELSPKFEHNGWRFEQQSGKKTWDYPAPVLQLQEQLKSAQSQSQADGSAIEKRGAPFWKIARIPAKKVAA
jgi:hypothetical protein